MGLEFQGDWTWFGAARTNHAPQLQDGTRAGGLLGMVRNDKPDRYGELRPSFDLFRARFEVDAAAGVEARFRLVEDLALAGEVLQVRGVVQADLTWAEAAPARALAVAGISIE